LQFLQKSAILSNNKFFCPERKDMPVKKKTKPVRKTTRAKKVIVHQKQRASSTSFVEYLRLGESYTSLVLGIIAVIIATILLLSFVHNRQAENQKPEVVPTAADSKSLGITPTETPIVTQSPTASPATLKSAEVSAPPSPTATPAQSGKTYTVVAGDHLWAIAEKVYKDGYKWVDIARENKLADPSDIHVGNKLVLPAVSPAPTSEATVHTPDDNLSSTVAPNAKIAGTTYTIVEGDDLWDIAVRAYNDGYKWTKIAEANKLTNPSLIHVGNKLKIPGN
jgi:nucleoid-associated protein YgaU